MNLSRPLGLTYVRTRSWRKFHTGAAAQNQRTPSAIWVDSTTLEITQVQLPRELPFFHPSRPPGLPALELRERQSSIPLARVDLVALPTSLSSLYTTSKPLFHVHFRGNELSASPSVSTPSIGRPFNSYRKMKPPLRVPPLRRRGTLFLHERRSTLEVGITVSVKRPWWPQGLYYWGIAGLFRTRSVSREQLVVVKHPDIAESSLYSK